ncbi:MAG TPA: PGPGW domain-containing protein [Lacipirellulaceae bacterium]|nr:PGPGW domain-containing protein [Lacipirellulaceae bacterium]
MEWIGDLIDWAKSNETLLWSLAAGSVALFLLTPVVVAWAIVRLPEDYFVNKRRQPLESWQHRPILRDTILIGKNVLGSVLIVAGVLMLLMPGQGLLTIVAGLILLNFPGKFRLERRLATQRHVWKSINWLRKRFGRRPLERPK